MTVDVPGWMQMCAATYPTLGKPRGGGNASGSNPAAPSAALNPDANVYSPSHPNHHDGGLDVQAPGGGDGGGAADPTKYKEIYGRWCHFVKQTFDEADMDKDGKLSFAEFRQVIEHTNIQERLSTSFL